MTKQGPVVRILLDHCVPVDLAPHIRGHEVSSVRDHGWQDLSDGDLLSVLGSEFDVLLTVDGGISFQQLIADRPFAVIVLRSKSNRVGDLARMAPSIAKALKSIGPGKVREIGG